MSYQAIVDRLRSSGKPQGGNTSQTQAKDSHICDTSIKVRPDGQPERGDRTDPSNTFNTEGSVNMTLPREFGTRQDQGDATIDLLVTASQPLQSCVSSPTKGSLDHCVVTPNV